MRYNNNDDNNSNSNNIYKNTCVCSEREEQILITITTLHSAAAYYSTEWKISHWVTRLLLLFIYIYNITRACCSIKWFSLGEYIFYYDISCDCDERGDGIIMEKEKRDGGGGGGGSWKMWFHRPYRYFYNNIIMTCNNSVFTLKLIIGKLLKQLTVWPNLYE